MDWTESAKYLTKGTAMHDLTDALEREYCRRDNLMEAAYRAKQHADEFSGKVDQTWEQLFNKMLSIHEWRFK